VIGPLVLCGALFERSTLDALKSLGVKDSKQLRKPVRESLSREIRELADDVFTVAISPAEIDRENINHLELKATVKAIQNTDPDRVEIDVPVHPRGIPNYMRKLSSLLREEGVEVELLGANKADQKYVAVSAASVIAKVERDSHIERLKEEVGDFGSGYPSDEKTLTFLRILKERGDMPEFVRKKWKIRKLSDQGELFQEDRHA
jgi:ribonuclease HII